MCEPFPLILNSLLLNLLYEVIECEVFSDIQKISSYSKRGNETNGWKKCFDFHLNSVEFVFEIRFKSVFGIESHFRI